MLKEIWEYFQKQGKKVNIGIEFSQGIRIRLS